LKNNKLEVRATRKEKSRQMLKGQKRGHAEMSDGELEDRRKTDFRSQKKRRTSLSEKEKEQNALQKKKKARRYDEDEDYIENGVQFQFP
jgi:hypothetical protein